MRWDLLGTWLTILWAVALDTALTQAAVQARQASPYTYLLKGQCHEIFDFFHESVSPKPLSMSLGPFRNGPNGILWDWGEPGNWFMKKVRSKKSHDTVPLKGKTHELFPVVYKWVQHECFLKLLVFVTKMLQACIVANIFPRLKESQHSKDRFIIKLMEFNHVSSIFDLSGLSQHHRGFPSVRNRTAMYEIANFN